MNFSDPFFLCFVAIIYLFANKFLTNWWFDIEERKNLQKAQVALFIELCKKQGVSDEVIHEIKAEYKLLPKEDKN